jgi:hypothetical protein
MKTSRVLSLTLAGLSLTACAAEDGMDPTGDGGRGVGGKADEISPADDPSGLLVNADRRLASLVSVAEVGQSFGVPTEEIPYPDTYWPMVDNGIAVEWLESTGQRCSTFNECDDPQPSPLAKFVAMTDTDDNAIDEAVRWEVTNHGEDVPNVASWFGHCPGWVATAMLYKPVTEPLTVRFDNGEFHKCEEDEDGCTTFEIGDLNALGAEAHEGARSRFIGSRCDTDPDDIERDDFGRIVRNGTGCKGLNAGSLLILLGNRLKNEQKPFAIDAQQEFTTEQIWNQPAFRYTLNRFHPLTEAEAANLVESGGDSDEGDATEYQFNEEANGFAFVDVTLDWVTEQGPNLTPVSGANSFHSTRMVAVIELDGDPEDPQTEVIGGEYLDDPSVGANRLRVHPFAWIAIDAGPDFRHNPFVKADLVKQLLTLATEGDDGGSANTECAHDICEEGGALQSGCNDCVTSICEADAFCCTNSWDSLCADEVNSVCGQAC